MSGVVGGEKRGGRGAGEEKAFMLRLLLRVACASLRRRLGATGSPVVCALLLSPHYPVTMPVTVPPTMLHTSLAQILALWLSVYILFIFCSCT